MGLLCLHARSCSAGHYTIPALIFCFYLIQVKLSLGPIPSRVMLLVMYVEPFPRTLAPTEPRYSSQGRPRSLEGVNPMVQQLELGVRALGGRPCAGPFVG